MTIKPAETRMGKGKGNPEYWVTVIKPGRIMFEIEGVPRESAQRAVTAERELNDFIAHEVRNPLAAAISACSFVSSSVNEVEPLLTSDSGQALREDLRIIDNSLQFINNL